MTTLHISQHMVVPSVFNSSNFHFPIAELLVSHSSACIFKYYLAHSFLRSGTLWSSENLPLKIICVVFDSLMHIRENEQLSKLGNQLKK